FPILSHRGRQGRHGRARARLSLGSPLGLACCARTGRDAAHPTAIPARASRSPRGCFRRASAEQGLSVASSTPVPGEPHGSQEKSNRKSTRLNSSHGSISYAVFCLKKKIDDRSRYTMTKSATHTS